MECLGDTNGGDKWINVQNVARALLGHQNIYTGLNKVYSARIPVGIKQKLDKKA